MKPNELHFDNVWNEITYSNPPGTTILTLSQQKPNEIISIDDTGIEVKTEKGIDLVEIDLIKKAWENLVNDGILYQHEHEKSTHRSSFILALFNKLNYVELNSEQPLSIILNIQNPVPSIINSDINYFIFVFNEENYEDETALGIEYHFPDLDRGGYKFSGKTTGSWGAIIDKVSINDIVLWYISGKSKRVDKGTFWGQGKIIEVDNENRLWKLESKEFENKIKLDEVVKELSEEYQDLYTQKHGGINIGYYGTIQIDEYQYDFIKKYCKGQINLKKRVKASNDKIMNSNLPKIIIMNINPENIDNCVQYTIHGAKINTGSVGNSERLTLGDICIIRQTSKGGRARYGVKGIWFFEKLEDIEGIQESLWIPPDVWKYKLYMKPLVKEFETLFEEDFSKPVEGQLRHKESTKVKDLLQTDIQGAVRAGFRDQNLPIKYLKAIIEEKKEECDIEATYTDLNGEEHEINVYDFLHNLTINVYDFENEEGDIIRNSFENLNFHELTKDFLKHLEKIGLKIREIIIYRIFAAIKSGKNLIITGPPGSGKTTLAKELAIFFKKKSITRGYILATATSDWSTFETIGGYILSSDNRLIFKKGIFLESIKEKNWLIIDEINRADIDKALGELHTVIAGQSVTLPFEENKKRIKIIPPGQIEEESENFESYYIDPTWRIIGTMNNYDKSFLYNLSYALMRRFSFIDISIPEKDDYDEVINDKLQKITFFDEGIRNLIRTKISDTVNIISRDKEIRDIGPAIMIDSIEYIANRSTLDYELDSGDNLKFLGEAFILNLLPQFEGLRENEFTEIEEVLKDIFRDSNILGEILQKLKEIKSI